MKFKLYACLWLARNELIIFICSNFLLSCLVAVLFMRRCDRYFPRNGKTNLRKVTWRIHRWVIIRMKTPYTYREENNVYYSTLLKCSNGYIMHIVY